MTELIAGNIPATFLRAGLIPVIGYVRVSTWREEMISIDIQKSVIKDAALRRGRYVERWIEDPDASGRNFKRKIMVGIELVEDENTQLNEIWVWKFSRFGRSRYGVAINLARIEVVGGELISATEDVDAKTAVGRFTRGMLLEVAAFESDRAGEQWKETHELRRTMGLPAQGGRRFGYLWHPRVMPDGLGGMRIQEEWYEVIGNQAEVTYEGYRRYTRGTIAGFGKIAVWWNDLGFLNTRGAPWQDQTVKHFFDSGFAAGLLVVHKHDLRCKNSRSCQKPEHRDYRPAEHEAILDGAEWEEYNERRSTRRQTPVRALDPVYPLAGLTKCGLCRVELGLISALAIHQVGTEPGYGYRCGARARHHVQHDPVYTKRVHVEREVFRWLLDVRDEIDAIIAGRIVIPQPRRDPGTAVTRKRLEKEISKLIAGLDRATEGNVMGKIPDDTYVRTRDRLTAQRQEKEKQLVALGPEEPATLPSPRDHHETVLGLIKEWDTISVAAKRVTLATLIRRVEVFPKHVVEVVPVWAPADPPELKTKQSRALLPAVGR
ncbi:recombinase family protein [Streptomyces sp. NPDC056647]|uniref:recombinase family protein n=1 Tax=unclassified Streptomyces TaxID=2593676 RepID=UPI0036AFFF58